MIRPFVRFGDTVFDAEELAIERFPVLDDVKADLHNAGLETIDQIATSNAQQISSVINVDADYANQLIELSQDLMYAIVEDDNE